MGKNKNETFDTMLTNVYVIKLQNFDVYSLPCFVGHLEIADTKEFITFVNSFVFSLSV